MIRLAASSKRIILATFGSPGDLQPFLAVGAALARRGHDVVIATSEMYREQVGRAGLGFAPIRPDRTTGQPDPDFLDRIGRGRELPGEIFRQMFLPALRESTEDLLDVLEGADLVVSHTLVAGSRLAAEVHRTRWISAVMQPMGYLSAFEPPVVGPPWIAALLRAAGPGLVRVVYRPIRRLTGHWSSEWHELRAEFGLPAVCEHAIWDGQHAKQRSLGLFPRVMGMPQPDWPASARVTGFPFFQLPGRKLDTEVLEFIASGPPPLIFTLGTTAVNDPGSFYEESAAAAEAIGRRAILIAGPGNLERLNNSSKDVLAIDFAPHDLLFPFAEAVIHQGGIGTLSEAMRAKKPMIIMPYAHDQADNAWRASRLGIATIISRRRYRRDLVARALRQRLDDRATRAATARVAGEIARETGAETAATYIEQSLD